MDKKQFLEEFDNTLTYMLDTAERKNHDYSWGEGESNPFKNFQLVEQLGVTSVERGFLVRMCDKLSRIVSLIDNEAKVKDEAIEDTLVDLANYAIIMSIYVKDKRTTARKNIESLRWRTCIEWSTSWF